MIERRHVAMRQQQATRHRVRLLEVAQQPRDDRRVLNLMRREDSILDDRIDRGGTEDVLVEGIKRIDFAYWDSDKKDWVDEWDTRRIEKKSILPVRVRITISAVDETGREARYVTQARIVLNTEIPRF